MIAEILTQLDRDIERLQEAKAILSGSSTGIAQHTTVPTAVPAKTLTGKPRGRPKGSTTANTAAKSVTTGVTTGVTPRRTISPEGRKAIAEAMKRRWAAKRVGSVTGSKGVR